VIWEEREREGERVSDMGGERRPRERGRERVSDMVGERGSMDREEGNERESL